MIQFKDFVPKQVSKGGFLSQAQYESIGRAVLEADNWVRDASIEVINIETVVLPNMHSPREEGSTDSSLHQDSEWPTSWHQFIRIWYQA